MTNKCIDISLINLITIKKKFYLNNLIEFKFIQTG